MNDPLNLFKGIFAGSPNLSPSQACSYFKSTIPLIKLSEIVDKTNSEFAILLSYQLLVFPGWDVELGAFLKDYSSSSLRPSDHMDLLTNFVVNYVKWVNFNDVNIKNSLKYGSLFRNLMISEGFDDDDCAQSIVNFMKYGEPSYDPLAS